MRFYILTLFPDMVMQGLNTSIIGKAMEKGLLSIEAINIRDYTKDKHLKVDDYPYGGGAGMVMQAQPIYDAYMSIAKDLDYKPLTIYMSPQGKVFNQQCAIELSQTENEHIIILCGHYEGVDQRVLDEIVDEEISIGDYVLTGGELGAMVLVDGVVRMLDGVLSNADCYEDESHFSGLLEYPQYTRPEEWHGKKVPEILLSGHHANIRKWRREQSLIVTAKKRPDMLDFESLNSEEKALVESLTVSPTE